MTEPRPMSQPHQTNSVFNVFVSLTFVTAIACAFLIKEPEGGGFERRGLAALPTLAKRKHVAIVTQADLDIQKTELVQKKLLLGQMPSLLKNASLEIKEKVKSGEMKFYTFNVFSKDVQGDGLVELSISGQVLDVIHLTRAGTDISIPLDETKPQKLLIRAISDDHRVIFGAMLSSGEIRTKVMAMGESDSFEVKFFGKKQPVRTAGLNPSLSSSDQL